MDTWNLETNNWEVKSLSLSLYLCLYASVFLCVCMRTHAHMCVYTYMYAYAYGSQTSTLLLLGCSSVLFIFVASRWNMGIVCQAKLDNELQKPISLSLPSTGIQNTHLSAWTLCMSFGDRTYFLTLYSKYFTGLVTSQPKSYIF